MRDRRQHGGISARLGGIGEHDTAQSVRPVCHAGDERVYLHQLHFSWADDEANCDPTARAIRTGQPVIEPDIANLSSCAPWRAVALACGSHSMIALPLQVDGQVIGALTLHGAAPNAFSPEEIQLLTELAGDLSYGISALRLHERQRHVEEALRQADEALRLTQFPVDRAGEMIFWFDFDGRLLYVNEAGCRRLGYTPEELQHMTVFDIDPLFSREIWPQHWSGSGNNAPLLSKRSTGRKMGEIYPVEVSINYIEYNGREYNFAFAHDITERKRVEEALKEADRAKSQFLMVLSHEVKTPLTSIIGWAQLAQSSPDLIPEALTSILRSAHEQKLLLERLLILSRILMGKLLLACQQTDLWPLVEHTVQKLQHIADERHITFLLEPPAEELPIEADSQLLEQAIGEVMENAVHFTPSGGTINMQGRREQGEIVFMVHDSGQGITSTQLSTLSMPFTQLQRKEELGGLGIGLALARGIIEAHGGRVTISSAGPDQGTTVTLWLPARQR